MDQPEFKALSPQEQQEDLKGIQIQVQRQFANLQAAQQGQATEQPGAAPTSTGGAPPAAGSTSSGAAPAPNPYTQQMIEQLHNTPQYQNADPGTKALLDQQIKLVEFGQEGKAREFPGGQQQPLQPGNQFSGVPGNQAPHTDGSTDAQPGGPPAGPTAAENATARANVQATVTKPQVPDSPQSLADAPKWAWDKFQSLEPWQQSLITMAAAGLIGGAFGGQGGMLTGGMLGAALPFIMPLLMQWLRQGATAQKLQEIKQNAGPALQAAQTAVQQHAASVAGGGTGTLGGVAGMAPDLIKALPYLPQYIQQGGAQPQHALGA